VPATALNHCNFQASRATIDQLKDFYCLLVGLEVGPRPPLSSFGYWLYAGGRPVIHLSEENSRDQRVPFLKSTFHHLAFSCSGPDEMEAALIRYAIPYRRAYVPGSGDLQLFFQDPAGNGVELNFAAS
jgi:catechol-2,3-dioxygenase